MNVTAFKTMNYEQITMNDANKNKPNQTQNKPNLLDAQMNISSFKTMNYEQRTMNDANKNKPNTKPIRTQSNPISTQKKLACGQIPAIMLEFIDHEL